MAVTVRALQRFARDVPLAELKQVAADKLPELVILRRQRLSVSPVTQSEWDTIVAMGSEAPVGADGDGDGEEKGKEKKGEKSEGKKGKKSAAQKKEQTEAVAPAAAVANESGEITKKARSRTK